MVCIIAGAFSFGLNDAFLRLGVRPTVATLNLIHEGAQWDR